MTNKFFYSLATIFLICLIINFSRQIIKTLRFSQKLDDLEAEVVELEKKKEELVGEFKKVQGVDFIEENAREKLGMAKEGEKIIILPSVAPEDFSRKVSDQKVASWRQWWNLFVY